MYKYYRGSINLMTDYDRSKIDEVYSLMITTIEDRIEKWRHEIKLDYIETSTITTITTIIMEIFLQNGNALPS
jgi:hypothetical protein